TLPRVFFNTVGSEEVRKYGLPALTMYQREYDEVKRVYKQKPKHDWASNPADAFRYLSLSLTPNAARDMEKAIQMHKPTEAEGRQMNLVNLFEDRASRKASSRI